MALSNLQRVERALALVERGLRPWVARVLATTAAKLPKGPDGLFTHLLERWEPEPAHTLGDPGKRLVEDLLAAHKRVREGAAFTADQTYRTLDDCVRLLTNVSARDEESEVSKLRQEFLRIRYDEEARKETKQAASPDLQSNPTGGLKAWRDVVTPHPDVARGTYQKAEFAADLWAVVSGDASEEYRDPTEFFRRTYLTEGLRQLLRNALLRLGPDSAGDPVIELQTTFGGGKTHSMLALYHLFSGVAPSTLPGLETVLADTGVTAAIPARRAVLVGNKLSPGQPEKKDDGTLVRTLWGELAWQLGGREAYEMVRESDERATNPGDHLTKVFKKYGPCVVLIDEWVAYARQLFSQRDLPGGTFETHFTFAQQLSEAAKAAPRTLLVVSIPASEHVVTSGKGAGKKKGPESNAHDIEVGGERGQDALERLKNAIGRVESPWRAASAEETYEIVRRRLFQPIATQQLFAARDAVLKKFMELYRANPDDFPSEVREKDYERRLQASYPLHPELFDRLSNEWSSLPRFQRTRGVLRLMAAVVHRLFHDGDRTLMILPASVPLASSDVQAELARHLDDHWTPVLTQDVDGPASLAMHIDQEHPLFGKVSAARRVARAIFMATAPVQHAAQPGIEEKYIKLGCVQPGEQPSAFGDATKRLADRAKYLYVEQTRFRFGVQATVSRLAEDRAADMKPDEVAMHLVERIKEHFNQGRDKAPRGDFHAVHPAPRGSENVPDERATRLVVLDPDDWHTPNSEDSPGRAKAQEILDHHGTGPRAYRNALIFLAPDRRRLVELQGSTRKYLAWKKIVDDAEALDLTPTQKAQAQQRSKSANDTVALQFFETWCLVLVPDQEASDGQGPPPPPEWRELKLQTGGSDPLGVRVSKKLATDELLLTTLAGTVLRHHLDKVPLWRGDHVAVKTLAEDFAKYLYLPRLQRTDVLLAAIRGGIENVAWHTETFAWAERYNPEAKRYAGLKAGTANVQLSAEGESVLVKGTVANAQMESDARATNGGAANGGRAVMVARGGDGAGSGAAGGGSHSNVSASRAGASDAGRAGARTEAREEKLTKMFARVELEGAQLGARAEVLGKEVLRHLTALPRARVTVTLHIEAHAPDGVPADVVRIVRENCRTLGVEDVNFEEESE